MSEEVVGIKEFEQLMDELGAKITGQLFKSIIRPHASSVKNEILSSLPADYPDKNKTVKVKADKYSLAGLVVTEDYVVKWADQGTDQRVKKSGASTGEMKAENFTEPIIDRKGPEIAKQVADELGELMFKALKKYEKRMANKAAKFK